MQYRYHSVMDAVETAEVEQLGGGSEANGLLVLANIMLITTLMNEKIKTTVKMLKEALVENGVKISYKINTKAKLTKLLINSTFEKMGESAKAIVDSFQNIDKWYRNYQLFNRFIGQDRDYMNYRYGHSYKNILSFDIFDMGWSALKNAKCELVNGIESIVVGGMVPMLGKLRNGVQSSTENIIQLPIVINGVLQKSKANNSTIPKYEYGLARFLQYITVEIALAKNNGLSRLSNNIEFYQMQKLAGRIKHKKISDIIGKQWCKLGKQYGNYIVSIEPIHFDYQDVYGNNKELITYCVNFKTIED